MTPFQKEKHSISTNDNSAHQNKDDLFYYQVAHHRLKTHHVTLLQGMMHRYKVWCIDTVACINTQDHQVSIATNSRIRGLKASQALPQWSRQSCYSSGGRRQQVHAFLTIVEVIQDKEGANTGCDAHIPRPNSNLDANWGHCHGETPATYGAPDLGKC